MNNSLARLDLTEIFCDVDDFYQRFNRMGEAIPQLPYDGQAKSYRSKLSPPEVMSIVIDLTLKKWTGRLSCHWVI
jgi:hypothetical protein